MPIRPYLFMAGEYNVTMPLVFSMDNWSHTMRANQLIVKDGVLYSKQDPKTPIKGVVYMARTEAYELELSTLQNIKETGIKCWPNVDLLMRLSDRHSVMKECVEAGLASKDVRIVEHETVMELYDIPFKYPLVVKTGQAHLGQDKFKLESPDDWLTTKLIGPKSTVEPFYEGRSVRVLFIGEAHFGMELTNDESWIKNTVGAEIHDWTCSPNVVEHARKVKDLFGLEIAGIDYIIGDNDEFHFLEINQYPGLHLNEETVTIGRAFLKAKMSQLELE